LSNCGVSGSFPLARSGSVPYKLRFSGIRASQTGCNLHSELILPANGHGKKSGEKKGTCQKGSPQEKSSG
jgi:hypothetical protein